MQSQLLTELEYDSEDSTIGIRIPVLTELGIYVVSAVDTLEEVEQEVIKLLELGFDILKESNLIITDDMLYVLNDFDNEQYILENPPTNNVSYRLLDDINWTDFL